MKATNEPICFDEKKRQAVIVRLQGGLGNQLFQYATAYATAKERDAELILDPTTGFTNDPFRRSFRLSCFTLSGKIADAEDMQSCGVVSSIVSRMYRKTEWILNTRFGLYYLPRLLRPQFGNPLVLDGYYQSYRYFSAFQEALRAEFQIKREVISREAEKWQAIIASEDSIALHVRRSSYERKCSAEYYINAVRKLRAEQPRAKVFIFADDHRWVTENLLPFFEASPIQIESETSDLEEFWLMTTCRHFIIANSTYSWWAAWLGSYAEKRVVAPRDGWCKGKTVVKDLLPPEWETVRGRERTLESETQGMEEKPKRFRHRALRLLKAYATLGQFIHSTTLLGDDLQALTAQTLSFHDGFLRPLQVEDELASLLGDVKALNPATVLEIGTAQGGTLYLWTRLAREDALVVSVDLPGGKFGGGYSRLRIPIYRRFARARQALHLLRANSHDPSTLAKVKKLFGARPIDLLFIDGDHTYEGVKQDWEMYSPLVRSGGLVVFHDISGNYGDTEVKKYWDSIRPAYNHKEYSHYPGGKCGIGVLVK